MKKIAIVGTGIAGLGCAHFLHKHFDIVVFEQNNYIGGHTNTVYIPEGNISIPVDTGFIVCNQENYPLLIKLFKQLNVPLKKTFMSFAAHIVHENIEYCGSSLNKLFAQRKNIFNPRYIKFLRQLNRFNKECIEILNDTKFQSLSIQEYCNFKKFNQDLLNWYLLPMSSALWSTPPETSSKFPALNLVRFFKNHGFLGLDTQFQWYTVDGGSEEYKKRLIEPFKDKIRINSKVVSIKRNVNDVEVGLENGEMFSFDKVILASHADQTLRMLSDITDKEEELLSQFAYEKNKATLHTDETIMPNLKKVWSSWNYRIEKKNDNLVSSCTYWMNSLQDVSKKKNYFVTINDQGNIDEKKIIREFEYEHPIFTVEAMQMQNRLSELNTNEQIYFCGSYFRYGFHEDAFMSAVNVCSAVLKKDIWS
ncbi:MAG: FAD-dependent oxidoreductase [Fimbriimonadaceae bacterium]|nr:FAD-dependent oxidoreductase [Chitinophagales bacterium]